MNSVADDCAISMYLSWTGGAGSAGAIDSELSGDANINQSYEELQLTLHPLISKNLITNNTLHTQNQEKNSTEQNKSARDLI